MTNETPIRAAEICSCAGGMALGFRRAGVEFEWVVDKDDDACASYTHNLGHAPIRMDLRDLLRLVRTGWRAGPLDLLVADPPCQPWSSAGKQLGLEDDRDCLRPLIDLVLVLLPRAFLLGNVPGLEHTNAEDALRETVGKLSYHGYCVDHVVLDAADYGVPQRRIRPFWFAHRGGPCITWPSPTHGRPSRQLEIGGTELAPWVTCRQALSDLPAAELGQVRRVRPHKSGHGFPWSEIDAPAHTILAQKDGGPRGGTILKVHKRHPPSTPDEPSRTICARSDGGFGGGDVLQIGDSFPPSHVDEPGRTVTTRSSGGGNRMLIDAPIKRNGKHPPSAADAPSHTIGAKARGNGGSVLEWPWDRPSTTVCAENWIPQPGHCHVDVQGEERQKVKSYQGWHAIVLSERARSRLQSFPDTVCGCNGGFPLAEIPKLQQAVEEGDVSMAGVSIADVCQECWLPARDWKFVGATKGSRNAQIGMAMPPLLAEAIARSVAQWFSIVNEQRDRKEG